MTDSVDVGLVQNNAGGMTFKVNDWDRLDRFLILGTESNTYYQSGSDLARDNAKHVISLLRKSPRKVIKRVVEISQAGRAPKNEYALFVLALAASDNSAETRKHALDALPQVARTGTHLFNFVSYAEQFRGWGRAMRRAVGDWYSDRSPDELAYQVVKYQSRNGWSNRDLLRLAHPTAKNDEFDAVFRWVTSGLDGLKAVPQVTTPPDRGHITNQRVTRNRKDVTGYLPKIIEAFEEAKTAGENRIIQLILDHNLPREAVPTQHLTSPKVWEALLQKMPMTAMIRNLATMTRVGLLTPGSVASDLVTQRLADQNYLVRSKIHPLNVLMALKTYEAGRGVRGSNTWTPTGEVVDALDAAFYLTFGNVTPTGKKTLLALDVSGSMSAQVNGMVGMTARDVSVAMALVTASVEPEFQLVGFTQGGWSQNQRNSFYSDSIRELNIDTKKTLSQNIKALSNLPFSGTNCSLPFMWATAMNHEFENFSVYTDNETYASGDVPSEALRKYRAHSGLPAKLAVFGVTATQFTIADPNDSGMMDFVGFDSAAPELAQQFFAK